VAPAEFADSGETIDLSGLKSDLSRLAHLLADGDSAATDFWDERVALFGSAFPDRWREIGKNIRRFDFEAALTGLKAAAASRGVEV